MRSVVVQNGIVGISQERMSMKDIEVGDTVTVTPEDYAGQSGVVDHIGSDGTIWVVIDGLPLPFSPEGVEAA